MPTFEFKDPIESIEEPELLPNDWTPVEILEEPTIGPNGALREALEEAGIDFETAPEDQIEDIIGTVEKAGLTMTVRCGVISPNPKYDGRKLPLWMSWPSGKDEGLFTQSGQKKSHWKMAQLTALSAACGNKPKGKKIPINEGDKFSCLINVRNNFQSGEKENFIDGMAGYKVYKT